MEVRRPLGAREVCVELERYAPAILARHKDPLASVTTVLNRLVDYGSAQPEQRPRATCVGMDQRHRTVGGRDAHQDNGLSSAPRPLKGPIDFKRSRYR